MSGVIIDLKELFKQYDNVEDLLDYLWDMLIENGWIELRWGLKRPFNSTRYIRNGNARLIPDSLDPSFNSTRYIRNPFTK